MKQRTVLAALLLHRGRTATAEELIDALWWKQPPPYAMASLRSYISRLRYVLEPVRLEAVPGSAREKTVFDAGGYALHIAADALDLAVFKRLVTTAEDARRRGDLSVAAEKLRSALDLGTDEPLSGIPCPWAEKQRTYLNEQRLSTLVSLFDIELKLGRHTEAVPDLTTLSSAHPLDERLRELLILALYQCGRRAEALSVYADTHRALTDELGIGPNPELVELHRKILNNDPVYPLPTRTVTSTIWGGQPYDPGQPPPSAPLSRSPLDITDFAGREREFAQLTHALNDADHRAMPVICIIGEAGTGKTTLATHLSSAVRNHYPDGQLFIDLSDADPAKPDSVLADLLHTLGVAQNAIPENPSRKSALLQAMLAIRRILLILDNVRDGDQIRPLLPGSPGCGVIVTSRSRLVRMHATTIVELDGLNPRGVVDLFGEVGDRRELVVDDVDGEQGAVLERRGDRSESVVILRHTPTEVERLGTHSPFASEVPTVRPMHRLLLAVDVEKYSARDARDQLWTQEDLRNLLSIAAENVGLDRNRWYEQVSGDGELAVLPEDVDVSLVVGDFTRQLQLVLAEFNQRHTRSVRLRIRVALHHGPLTPGPFGPAGDAPIVVSRLLNAKPLRRVLADHPERDVALILSSSLYRDVVSTGFCDLDPDGFEAVRVVAKGVLYKGFIQRAPSPPLRSEAVQAVDAVAPPVSAAENSVSALVTLLLKVFGGTADKAGERLWDLTVLVRRIFGRRSTSLEAVKRLGERPGDPESIRALAEALAADAARDQQAGAQLHHWIAAAERTIDDLYGVDQHMTLRRLHGV